VRRAILPELLRSEEAPHGSEPVIEPLPVRLERHLGVRPQLLFVEPDPGSGCLFLVRPRRGRAGEVLARLLAPFAPRFRKWRVPPEIVYDPDSQQMRLQLDGSEQTSWVTVPSRVARLMHRLREHPDVEETAVFEQVMDPILAVRSASGEWYELMRWV